MIPWVVQFALLGLLALSAVRVMWRIIILRGKHGLRSGLLLDAGVFFLLAAANAGVAFDDHVIVVAKWHGGAVTPYEWTTAGVAIVFLVMAGGFLGAAAVLWIQRKEAARNGRSLAPA